MPPDRGSVKRPRLSFNCIECSHQKRRCDKLKPQCTTCSRLGKTCVYNTGTRDPETGQVSRETQQEHDTVDLTSSSLGRATQTDKPDVIPAPSKDSEIKVCRAVKLHRGTRERRIGQGFWGLLGNNNRYCGQSSVYQDLFYDEPKGVSSMPPPYISSFGLAKILHGLPTKPVCDALLHSFLQRVHPMYPLINILDFIPLYQLFWKSFASGSSDFPTKLLQDPTYLCALWAILYAGSSTISSMEWVSPPLGDLDQLQTIKRLGTACSKSLAACQHTNHPTLYSLTSSIIAHHFDTGKGLNKSLFIPTTVRLAQSIGLHLDDDETYYSERELEQRRRVWWHIVWLDVQTSIATGLPTCCPTDMVNNLKTVTKYGPAPGHTRLTDFPVAPSENISFTISMIMLSAAGRFRTANIQRWLINLVHTKVPRTSHITKFINAIKDHHKHIEDANNQIPVHGIPERGMIPSTLANATPHSSPDLYDDCTDEPSVLSTFVRMMLFLYKLETAIMFQQILLPDLSMLLKPDFSWNRIVQLCLRYLQCYLQFCKTPAFRPYAWWWSAYYGPRRCILLLLHYIGFSRPNKRDKQTILFCVDEFIDAWRATRNLVPVQCESTSLDMDILIKMRQQLEAGNIDGYFLRGDVLGQRASPTESGDVDYLKDLFDAEFWASLG